MAANLCFGQGPELINIPVEKNFAARRTPSVITHTFTEFKNGKPGETKIHKEIQELRPGDVLIENNGISPKGGGFGIFLILAVAGVGAFLMFKG